jgi:hypothetical protein
VRMGGIRPFDDIRTSARLHIGTCRLRKYHDSHPEDGRDFDVDILRAMYGGAPSRSMWSRSESTKFAHRQLSTAHRLGRWGVEGYDSVSCRACRSAVETVEHLVVSCTAKACLAARRRFFKALKQFAATSSANVGDFLQRRLTMTSDGRLLCGGDPTAAFGLVTGYLPTDLRMALWQDARDNDVAVRDFVTWFRKNVKKMLWRPTWEAAKAGDQAASNGGDDDDDDDPCAICGVSTLLPNGMPMRDVLVCDDCNARVHLACSGFKKVPRGS